jgi:hypothetical protein
MKTKEEMKKEVIQFLKEPKPERFGDFAKELLHHFVIKKQEQKLNEDIKVVSYNLAEIEFYYYGKGHEDRHTYIRMTNAGSWFFHGSGVDLAFQTIEDKEKSTLTSFGGILIRSIIRKEDNKTISGPIRCMEELINNNAGVLEWVMDEDSNNKDKDIADPIVRTGLTPFKAEEANEEKDYTKRRYKYYLKEEPVQQNILRYKYYVRQGNLIVEKR